MNSKPRSFQPSDYEAVSSWWKARGFPVIPAAFLPHTGRIVEGYAVAFLYRTDSPICWMEWSTTNPEADVEQRQAALDAVIEALLQEARGMGYRVVYTSVQHPGLLERLKAHGFGNEEPGMTNMMRTL